MLLQLELGRSTRLSKSGGKSLNDRDIKIDNLKEVKSTDARFKLAMSSLMSAKILDSQKTNNLKLPKFSFDEILNTTEKFPKIISNSIHPEEFNPWGKVYETVMGNRNDWANFEKLCNMIYIVHFYS